MRKPAKTPRQHVNITLSKQSRKAGELLANADGLPFSFLVEKLIHEEAKRRTEQKAATS